MPFSIALAVNTLLCTTECLALKVFSAKKENSAHILQYDNAEFLLCMCMLHLIKIVEFLKDVDKQVIDL